jgi:hypothetical protein
VFLVNLLGKVAFAYVYANVYANRPGIIQGIKLGLAVAVMKDLSALIGSWMLFPIGGLWPLLMLPFEFAMWVVSGAVVAMLYKPKHAVQPTAATTAV